MKKDKNFIYIIMTILGTATIVFLGLFLSYWNTSKIYKTQLENNYKKSMYEMIEDINAIEVDMSKVIATTDINTQRVLLSNINTTAINSVSNIENLPISYNNMTNINNILNKTSGYSVFLINKIFSNKKLENIDYEQLSNLHNNIVDIKYDLNNYMSSWNYNYSISDKIDYTNIDNQKFSAGIVDSESYNAKIPSLIYDGPFSESVLNKEIKGLGNIEYSKEEILSKLKTIFETENIEYLGDTKGKFSTYNFYVNTTQKLYVNVTINGGLILSINCECPVIQEKKFSVDDGISIAQNFAKNVGFENMYSVWYQVTGSVLYVNLAPIENHIIFYSDLVKVKVDLGTGSVFGMEATNYATNHIDRNFTSSIGLVDAMQKLNPELEVVEKNYCIIPDTYVGEVSAYEFICKWENYTYYIYLDSNTGEEVNILRVINTTNGELLL